jgi:hypothetical protein
MSPVAPDTLAPAPRTTPKQEKKAPPAIKPKPALDALKNIEAVEEKKVPVVPRKPVALRSVSGSDKA